MLESCVHIALNTRIATLRNVTSYLSCSELSEESISFSYEILLVFNKLQVITRPRSQYLY